MLNVMELLRDISTGENGWLRVGKTRRLTAASLERGIQCTLAAQIVVVDNLRCGASNTMLSTCRPPPPATTKCPPPSVLKAPPIMQFLMSLPKPSPAIIASVDGATAWFKRTAIYGMAIKISPNGGRIWRARREPRPIWPRRCAEIGTDRPIFGDRDKTVHDNMNEISEEHGAAIVGIMARRKQPWIVTRLSGQSFNCFSPSTTDSAFNRGPTLVVCWLSENISPLAPGQAHRSDPPANLFRSRTTAPLDFAASAGPLRVAVEAALDLAFNPCVARNRRAE